MLAWNPGHSKVLALLDENSNSSLKFHHTSFTDRSGFTSREALLTPLSQQVPPSLSPYMGPVSSLVANYAAKTETLLCSGIEAHKHMLQLLESLSSILIPGAGDLRVTALLSGLACTTLPTQDALYMQLGNLRILQSESALRASLRTGDPVL